MFCHLQHFILLLMLCYDRGQDASKRRIFGTYFRSPGIGERFENKTHTVLCEIKKLCFINLPHKQEGKKTRVA
uniref:Secreted protein n=1 Tax=Oncorhynchus tshawytscha TaxID=74940 RepID=A0A8C8IA86_ONCTS